MRTIRRGGRYLRVADPGWTDPLDGSYAALRGGRWNPSDSFPVVYMCRTAAVARANVHRLLRDQPYGPEDMRPDTAPVLVTAHVPDDPYANIVTDAGCKSAGLPGSYPRDGRGRVVAWSRCQPIGLEAHQRGLPGVAARSAATPRRSGDEELAFFGERRLRRGTTTRFEDWFWARPE